MSLFVCYQDFLFLDQVSLNITRKWKAVATVKFNHYFAYS